MRKLIVLFVVVAIAGCAGNDTRTFTGLATTPADSRLGTVIFVNPMGKECPSLNTKEFAVAAPLIAAGVSIAATYVVNSITTAMEEYKKGLSGSFGAAGIAGQASMDIGCIVIARGLMGEGKPPRVPDTKDFLANYYHQLGFQDYPAFYLELKVSVDPKASETLKLQPNYLSYAASVAKNSGSGRKHVGIALAFSDTAQKKPDEINEEKTFATFHHDLGRLEIGKRYKPELLHGTGASASLTNESFKKSSFNISAVVSESEDPGIAFQVLSETFSSKKADLQKALEETITNALDNKEK